MNIRKVKQGARITYYNGIYMILLGVFYFVFFNYIMKKNFISISKLWGFFSRYNADISYLFILFCILIGILLITQGITIIYLSDFIIKRKEKMTWVILFIVGIISWGGFTNHKHTFQKLGTNNCKFNRMGKFYYRNAYSNKILFRKKL